MESTTCYFYEVTRGEIKEHIKQFLCALLGCTLQQRVHMVAERLQQHYCNVGLKWIFHDKATALLQVSMFAGKLHCHPVTASQQRCHEVAGKLICNFAATLPHSS